MKKDQMTGGDLIKQENYEFSLEKKIVELMDRVDRRDKRGEIMSFVPNEKYRNNYDQIKWSK